MRARTVVHRLTRTSLRARLLVITTALVAAGLAIGSTVMIGAALDGGSPDPALDPGYRLVRAARVHRSASWPFCCLRSGWAQPGWAQGWGGGGWRCVRPHAVT